MPPIGTATAPSLSRPSKRVCSTGTADRISDQPLDKSSLVRMPRHEIARPDSRPNRCAGIEGFEGAIGGMSTGTDLQSSSGTCQVAVFLQVPRDAGARPLFPVVRLTITSPRSPPWEPNQPQRNNQQRWLLRTTEPPFVPVLASWSPLKRVCPTVGLQSKIDRSSPLNTSVNCRPCLPSKGN